MAFERVVDIYVRNWLKKPALGARISFALDGEYAGGVPNSEGRGSIRLPDREQEVTVTAKLGLQKRTRTLAENQDTLEIVFGLPIWTRVLAIGVLVGGVVLFLMNRGVIRVGDPAEVRSAYLEPGPRNKDVVVVFVHGLLGSDQTWVNNANSFPGLVAADPQFRDVVDVFVFEYYSPQVGGAPSMVDLADQLRATLIDRGVLGNHKQIIFVGHSMGGLVTRRFLLSNREVVDRVPFIFLYASPTNGAELAAIAGAVSANPQLRGLMPVEGNDLLQGIHSDWTNSATMRTLPTHCAFETLPTSGIEVVSRSSATALCNQANTPLTADHIETVKPADRDDHRYTPFARALRDALQTKAEP